MSLNLGLFGPFLSIYGNLEADLSLKQSTAAAGRPSRSDDDVGGQACGPRFCNRLLMYNPPRSFRRSAVGTRLAKGFVLKDGFCREIQESRSWTSATPGRGPGRGPQYQLE